MGGRRLLLALLAFVFACGGDDDAQPAKTTSKPDAAPREDAPAADRRLPLPDLETAEVPVALLALLPEDAGAYLHAESLDTLDRELGWLDALVDEGPFPALVATALEVDVGALDRSRPVGLALGRAGALVIAPLRDPNATLAPGTVRGRDGYAAAGSGFMRPGGVDPSFAQGLPRAPLAGFFDLGDAIAPVIASVAGDMPEGMADALLHVRRAGWSVRREGAFVQADAVLDTEPGGAFDSADMRTSALPDLLACLPREFPIVLGASFDFGEAVGLLQPLIALGAAADPSLAESAQAEVAAWKLLDRGFLFALDLAPSRLTAVMMANARDAEAFLTRYFEIVERGLRQNRIGTLEPAPDVQVDGVTVQQRRLSIDLRARAEAEQPSAFGLRYLSFRVLEPAGAEEARLARVREDAERVTARLRAAGHEADVLADPDHLFIGAVTSRGVFGNRSNEAFGKAVLDAVDDAPVAVHRAVHPGRATYGEYRDALARHLARRDGAASYPVPAAELADADRDAFPAGLRWVRIAANARGRVSGDWQHEGYMLLASEPVAIEAADFDWIYPSGARLGDKAPTRDVHFRVKDEARARVRRLADGGEAPALVVLLGREVFSGIVLDDALGQIPDLPADDARRLVRCLGRAALHHAYDYKGERGHAYANAWQMQQRVRKIFGSGGVVLRTGHVGRRVFAVLASDPARVREVILALRRNPPTPQPFVTDALAAAPDPDLLLWVDIPGVVDAFGEFVALLSGEEEMAREMMPELPDGLRPAVLAGWHVGPRFRALFLLDAALPEWIAERTRATAVEMQRYELRRLHWRVRDWQTGAGTVALPGWNDLEAMEYEITDAWGGMLRLEEHASGARVRSAGPDGRFETDDDIVYPE